jgi:hypothetical protein
MTNEICKIIDDYQKNPGKYGFNVWVCYSKCKTLVQKTATNWSDYQKNIKYIANSLRI